MGRGRPCTQSPGPVAVDKTLSALEPHLLAWKYAHLALTLRGPLKATSLSGNSHQRRNRLLPPCPSLLLFPRQPGSAGPWTQSPSTMCSLAGGWEGDAHPEPLCKDGARGLMGRPGYDGARGRLPASPRPLTYPLQARTAMRPLAEQARV